MVKEGLNLRDWINFFNGCGTYRQLVRSLRLVLCALELLNMTVKSGLRECAYNQIEISKVSVGLRVDSSCKSLHGSGAA